MKTTSSITKLIPIIILVVIVVFISASYLRGILLVKRSEIELNPKKQLVEAQAQKYSLKEIDAITGDIRWRLTAKEGKTEENLQAALIKDIQAEVYKNKQIIFELNAPFAKGNSNTKELYLFGGVTAKNKSSTFLLTSNQIALGMNTSIEAQKGFNLILKDSGTVQGENALINDDQTKINVTNLKEAIFKDISLSGNEVFIEKDPKGDITKAKISNGGTIILKKPKNSTLSASSIEWLQNGVIKATTNVTYFSEDKTFKANYLLIEPNGKIYAKDKVFISYDKTKCYGNSLVFDNNSLITLDGKPYAIQNNTRISADKILFNLNTNKVEAIGNVKTIVTHNTEKTEKNKNNES